MPNDTTLLTNNYYRGVLSTETDTAYIRTLTDHSLILATRNPAGDWGRLSFTKN